MQIGAVVVPDPGWEHINRVLAASGGNISKAARLLGLPRKSLQRKLAKYPVPR